MKPILKMDDVLYPLRILHRYLSDTFRYVLGEYPKIKFIYFLKTIIRYFSDTYGIRAIDVGKPICAGYLMFLLYLVYM